MIVIPFLIAGFGVGGAIGASLAAAVIGVVLPAWYLRKWFTHRPPAPAGDRVALRSTLPVVVGILAFTSLTTFDVIIAKLAFSPDEAGMYGGASFIGRLILYVPAAIVAVLLPKVSSRTALGRKSDDILAKSLLATAAACILATAIYAIAPRLILTLAFGSKYEDAANLLWLFGLAMTGFALTNVLFVYHIGRANPGVSWILCAGALVQLAAFALVHDSGRQLLVVSSAIAYAVLAAVAVLTFSRGFRGRFSVTGRA
jgi:O-antigen/teichoic acid export membrane protein